MQITSVGLPSLLHPADDEKEKTKSLAAGLARGFVRVGRTGRPTPGSQAGGLGFEPRLTDPESAVLPLDKPPMVDVIIAGIFPVDKLENKGGFVAALYSVYSTQP